MIQIKQVVRVCLFVLLLKIAAVSSNFNTSSKLDLADTKNGEKVFSCKDKPRISRFPDPLDCNKFIYCISGSAHPAKCWPTGSRFNPATTRCDLPSNVPCHSDIIESTSKAPNNPFWQQIQEPSATQSIEPSSVIHLQTEQPIKMTPIPITVENSDVQHSTTIPPTTTTPKPPRLNEKFEFQLDCKMHPCGLYPNHNGNCSTYILCSNGVQTKKRCNGGQLFDVNTMECQEPSEAKCWKEPDNGLFAKSVQPKICNFHAKSQAISYQNTTDGIILTNPLITNWGSWQPWKSCSNGTYVTGINAWRRLLQSGSNKDHAGLISLALNCESPNNKGQNNYIESLAPGVPNDGWPDFYTCKGSGIGFRLNSQRDLGPWPNDNVATDNVQIICSCGTPVYKPYEAIPGEQTGNRGDWTAEQICGPRQALCGMQTQMADYRERVIGQYDNTGLNNMNIKCCDVPHPAKTCKPEEKVVLLRTCENIQGIYPRRCDFETSIGVTYDYSTRLQSINFYESIGYSLSNSTEELRQNFFENFPFKMYNEYSWDEPEEFIWKEVNTTSSSMRSIYLKVNTTVDLYQILGICSNFIIKTNRFIRNSTTLGSGVKTTEYFEV